MLIRFFIVNLIVVFIALKSSSATDLEQDGADLQRCKCVHYYCGCCSHIELDIAKINGSLCSDFSYLPKDIGISLTVTYNMKTIYNETLSVRNPPRICPIILEEIHVEVCIRFYDMDFDKHHFSGCAEADISAFRAIPLMKKDLGCFNIDHKNTSTSSTENYSVVMLK